MIEYYEVCKCTAFVSVLLSHKVILHDPHLKVLSPFEGLIRHIIDMMV